MAFNGSPKRCVPYNRMGVIIEVVPWFGYKLALVNLKWYFIIHFVSKLSLICVCNSNRC